MNYAEKIQLITGLIIWAAAITGYAIFNFYYKKLSRADLLPFLKVFMIAGFLIGTHQIFEFLSLHTENNVIYKLGLIGSISGMAFYGISLEKLYNRNLYIRYLNFILLPVAIYIFFKPVQFNAFDFYLEHHSIFIWSIAWLILFLYWNISGLFEQTKLKKYIPQSFPWIYSLFSMTISFLLAIIYSLWNYYTNNTNICITYPSIWCTFAFLQIPIMPILLYVLPHKIKQLPPKTTMPIKSFVKYFSLALFITVLIVLYLITTSCFNFDLLLK